MSLPDKADVASDSSAEAVCTAIHGARTRPGEGHGTRIHVITLAVRDLDRALAVYRDGLGLESVGMVGTELTGGPDAGGPKCGLAPCSIGTRA